MSELMQWTVFGAVVIALLWFDLAVLNRRPHSIEIKEALWTSAFWIGAALLFNLGIWYVSGAQPAALFLTGYLIEKSLSVDNLFVFLVIFSYFQVANTYQHRVLFWGIIGAVVMRGLLIVTGIALIEKFQWLIYILGIFLIFTGLRTAQADRDTINFERNPALRFIKRFIPVTDGYRGPDFFVKENGKYHVTPLFIVLVIIEITDVIFALDSIPAILAITLDHFLVFSSNLFAILGLRALYFALAGLLGVFDYLKYGISAILVLVGIKMVIRDYLHLPPTVTLGLIVAILTISVVASILFGTKKDQPAA